MDTKRISRRGFLKGVAGSALALTTGNLLAGCSGGGASTIPATRDHGRDLYVSTFINGTIERYDFQTGAHLDSITTGAGPAGMALGPNGDILVAMRFDNAVERYDIVHGVKEATIRDILAPHNVAVSPDGVLYVPNAASYYGFPTSMDTIEKFDARTGAHLGTFTHMAMPFSPTWGPDNNLYCGTALELGNTHPDSDAIFRFDGKTGALQGTVVKGDKIPFDTLFTPQGTILVSEYLDGRIQEYNPNTGASIRTFANVPFPIGLKYGPDGNLYVGSFSDLLGTKNSGSVQRLDPNTGASLGAFVTGLPFGAFLVIV